MLALVFKKIDCVGAIPNLAFHVEVARADFGHAFLDCSQIFRCKRPLIRKIVVKTILDNRADSDLRFRKQFLHGMCKQMRGGMADYFQPFRIFFGNNTDIAVCLDAAGDIHQLTIHFSGQRGTSQSGPNRCSDFTHRHWVLILALRTIRQTNDSHRSSL